jgi:phenylpyruvate tautomerase PptA (4-oxalocrotonate tautomerase family)
MAMPVVKTHLLSGRSVDEKRAIGDAVHAALFDVLEVPKEIVFQLFTEYSEANFGHNMEGNLDPYPSHRFLYIEFLFFEGEGRDDETKKAFLQALNANLVAKDLIHTEDVFVIIIEVPRANMGSGSA